MQDFLFHALIGWVDVDDDADTDAIAFSFTVESNFCHLVLFERTAFICVQRSFLHDFDLKIFALN